MISEHTHRRLFPALRGCFLHRPNANDALTPRSEPSYHQNERLIETNRNLCMTTKRAEPKTMVGEVIPIQYINRPNVDRLAEVKGPVATITLPQSAGGSSATSSRASFTQR